MTSYLDAIAGAATFDLSGLPRDYFTTAEHNDVSWVQTIFQALGLQSLLLSSLRLEGFRYAVIHGNDCRAIVIRQRSQYLALLLHQSQTTAVSEAFIRWLQDFDAETLTTHSRFQSS
ncbi:MAG: hypothetical protein KME20_20445 [Kaiparowitsia implicata GSE-PSE-MK54-09C]|nr:hypothetical protein [Kaiparowitsia implicata GSE-PSE-MK54-09C]